MISQPGASGLTVTQSSQSAVVNWQSFSVGQGNSVTFAQPNAASAILNRVTSDAPSTIAGQVNANGQVYLVNPNGIAITRSGTVNAGGGFVASTLGISDSDFMAGKRTFTGNGASAGVSNAGTISVGRGGYAALIGGTVSNSGSIDVPLGKVGLGSGERATLDFSGDGFLQVAMPTGPGGKGALIKNNGTIKADGGSVIISAATAREAARNAVNISGSVQARSIGGRSGSIVIGGGAGGRVKVTGRLDTSSRRHNGGSIQVTGKDIALKGATIDASGKTGGGTINIGGGYQGTGPLQRAETVSIDKATTIKADAIQSGNGGNVVVWSDLLTTFAGTISARGGALSGNGGDAEVSGKAKLDYTGTTILTAANGDFGTLLLDPYNVVISNGTDANGAFNGAAQTNIFTPTGNDSVINAATLNDALANSKVTITTGSSGSQAGNITVNAPISWSGPALLTLTAANAIAINAPITIYGGGKLALNAATTTVGNTTQPLLSFGTGASVIFSSGPSGQTLMINNNSYTLLRSMGDVAGINGNGFYALATDLTSSTTYNAAVVGSFSGTLEGLGHTISNLTIANGGGNVGLIGTLNSGGTVRDIGIAGGSISGASSVGGLVGLNNGGTVTQSYASVAVSSSAANSTYLGGLVGYNTGAITQSYATGNVSGTSSPTDLGGLAGYNSGAITQSYATGIVLSSSQTHGIGGLLGYNGVTGTVTQSFATGAIFAGSLSNYIGALIGLNDGSLNATFWNTATSGQSVGIGTDTNSQGANISGVTTAVLANATTLAALNTGNVAFGNAGNKTTPYLLNNLGPVFLGSDTAAAPTFYTPILTQAGLEAVNNRNSANYVLANSLDLSGTTYTGAVIGNFSGTLDGLGNTIANLTINGSSDYVGLIGMLNNGTVRNIGIVGGSVSGGNDVGGLVGYSSNGSITQAYATGAVTGTSAVGGLVGYSNNGSITQAYATGAVSDSGDNAGGLVGYSNGGSIRQAYATGAVSGSGGSAGGLVGNSNSGSITQAYATGAVRGRYYVGGLVGSNNSSITQAYATGATSGTASVVGGIVGLNSSNGTITQAYWNMQTAGASLPGLGADTNNQSPNVTGLTTAQLQGLDPLSGSVANNNAVYFSTAVQLGNGTTSTFAGGTGGLYPYLTNFFPNGVQAVSGIAYKDAGATALASGVNGAVGVTVVGANATLGSATTGANGYYYVFGQPGTIANGASVIAYTTANSATGATNTARIATSTYATNTPLQTGLDIYAPVALTFATTAQTTYSGYLASVNGTLPTAPLVPTGTAIPSFVSNSVPSVMTTGTSFAFDMQATISAPIGFATALSNAPLLVTAPVTVASGGALGLSAAGALTISSNITVNGAGGIALGFDRNTATPSTNDLSFGLTGSGFTGGITYLSSTGQPITSSANGALSINASSYTLLYSMTDVQNVNNNSAGNYALAGNLSAAGTIYTAALVGGNGNFSGNFEGLGHTLSSLTINAGVYGSGVGLFHANVGTIRDMGLVGGSVSGHDTVGGLVGVNAGTIQSSYATVAVSGLAGQQFYAFSFGGLVGWNFPNGTIQASYATGAVSNGEGYSGGLVGSNQGNITQSYATGAVSGSLAVSGGSSVGGLVGEHDTGTIRSSYATGAVSGSDYVGGLIGILNSGSVQSSYATGALSVSGSNVGGFVGNQQGGTITAGYWDTLTSGLMNIGIGGPNASQAGVTGLTTAQLQSNSNGFMSQLGAAFSGGTGGLYPYLTSFFPNGVQAVSGIAYRDAGVTPLASGANGAVGVTVIGANTTLGTATTGNNGYYYVFGQPGTIANGASVIAYTTANSTTGATNAARIATSTYATNTPIQTGLDIWAPVTLLAGSTNATSWSAAGFAAVPAVPTGSTLPSFLNGALPTYAATNAQGFIFDTPLTVSNPFALQTTASGAPITVSQPLTINSGGSLSLSAAGALNINSSMTVWGAGSVALAYDQNVTTFSINDLSFGLTGSGFAGSLTYLGSTGAAISSGAGGSLNINGTSYSLLYNFVDVAGVSNGLSSAYALAGNLDATSINFNRVVVNGLTKTLEGLGHTISNVTINSSANTVGLIGNLYNSGTVRDLGVVGGSFSGSLNVGGLVGHNEGGTVTQVFSTAAVSGVGNNNQSIGGLVGRNETGNFGQNIGTITQAFATGTVSGQVYVGGLVGENQGTISQSYATGAVNGTVNTSSNIGGLVGYISDGRTITLSYATGNVSGGSNVGGLVGGSVFGNIIQSYATGNVSGTSNVGGLIGDVVANNGSGGTISQSYATGNVTGTSSVGGLTGSMFGSNATISDSYATGAVSGSDSVGGLIGYNDVGGTTTTRSYATGYVTGATNVGGLVGTNQSYASITASYWNTQTTGQSNPIGTDNNSQSGNVTPLNTARFQYGQATALGNAFAGGANGIYPYLAWRFPTGVQAVSGVAYTDAGLTANQGASVGLVAGGTLFGTASTGANGYYYAFGAANTIAANASLLAYTTNTATLTTATGTTLQTGVNLYGNAVTVPTSAITLSAAPTLAQAQTLAGNAAGSNAAALVAINGATGQGFIASGASFDINQPVQTAGTFFVQTTAPGAPITVSQPIAINAGGSLGLLAAGALTVNSNITVNGGNSVNLGYDRNAQAFAANDLSFGFTAAGFAGSLTYAASGGALSINGNPYALIASMNDLAAMNGSSSNYALANNLTSGSYANAVVASFGGTLEGLGHSVNGLTINSTGSNIGLIGSLTGQVRDLGLVGGSVSGGDTTGALAGNNQGTITNVFTTASVTGGDNVGGLVGDNSGGISYAIAAGSVSGSGTVGGMVGSTRGPLQMVLATGTVSGNGGVGGLVGSLAPCGNCANSDGATIVNAMATGAVSGANSAGGLVANLGATGGLASISMMNVFATGAVSSGIGYGGGLGATVTGNVANGISDSQTTGQPNFGTYTGSPPQSGVISGFTTAYLQNNAAGILGAAFGGGSNGVYPYLKTFYPNGVQAVSGFAYKDAGATALASGLNGAVPVTVVGANSTLGTATTGNNGYYYVFGQPGTIANGASVIAYTTANNATGAKDAATYTVAPAGPNIGGVNVYGGWKLDRPSSSIATLSALNTFETQVAGSSRAASLILNNRDIRIAAQNFSLDAATSLTGTLALNSAGSVTQTSNGAIGAGALSLTGTAGSYTLTNSTNAVATIAGNTGSVAVVDSVSLATGSVVSTGNTTTTGVTTIGNVSLATSGSLTLASGAAVSGASPVLSTGTAFINNAGANGVVASTGRFLVWSQDPANDTIGGLSYDFRQYDASFGTTQVAANGNGLLYTLAPTANILANGSFDRPYDGSLTTRTLASAGLYISSGGVAGDTVAAVAGATGTFGSKDVGNSIPVSIAGSSLVFADAGGHPVYGYQISSAITGNITPKLISVNLMGGTSVYGSPPTSPVLSADPTDLVGGDTVTLTAAMFGGVYSNTPVGLHSIQALNISVVGNTNYAASNSGAAAQWTVTPRPLTITADAQSRAYGDANPALTYTIGGLGLVNGNTLTGALATSATATSNVGTYPITQGTLSASSNYVLSYVAGSLLTVTPAAITVTALGGTSVQGTSPVNPGLAASGLRNGEGIGVLTGLSNSFGITSTSSAADSPYMLTVVGALTNPNYIITQRIGGVWNVTAPLTAGGWIASVIANDNFYPTALPDNASPIFDVPPVATSLGTGTLYADPRFDSVVVCFGGGFGRAPSCYATGR